MASSETIQSATDTVAKWGEWHCGENKERFRGERVAAGPTLFERFIEGEAVRIQIIGEKAWQFRLAGEDWKKSRARVLRSSSLREFLQLCCGVLKNLALIDCDRTSIQRLPCPAFF